MSTQYFLAGALQIEEKYPASCNRGCQGSAFPRTDVGYGAKPVNRNKLCVPSYTTMRVGHGQSKGLQKLKDENVNPGANDPPNRSRESAVEPLDQEWSGPAMEELTWGPGPSSLPRFHSTSGSSSSYCSHSTHTTLAQGQPQATVFCFRVFETKGRDATEACSYLRFRGWHSAMLHLVLFSSLRSERRD